MNISVGGVKEIQTAITKDCHALKFTVHVVQSLIKGHRTSGVISTKHSRDMTDRISPLRVGSFSTCDCHI